MKTAEKQCKYFIYPLLTLEIWGGVQVSGLPPPTPADTQGGDDYNYTQTGENAIELNRWLTYQKSWLYFFTIVVAKKI